MKWPGERGRGEGEAEQSQNGLPPPLSLRCAVRVMWTSGENLSERFALSCARAPIASVLAPSDGPKSSAGK
jgi:hypothetical protein